MNISDTVAPTVLEKPQPPQRPPSDTSGDAGTSAGSTAVGTPPAATEVSDHAQVLHTLQSLSTTDPDKFKQAAAKHADTLKTLAAQTGGAQGAHLTRLAQKFDTAAQSGTLSALESPAPPAGSAQAAYAKSSFQPLRLPHVAAHKAPHSGHAKGAKSSVTSVGADVAPVSNALRFAPPQA